MKPLFADLKVGDKVIRMLAGTIPQEMKVSAIRNGRLICVNYDGSHKGADWEFDIVTGAEIDDDLDFGPPPKITASFLKHPNVKATVISPNEIKARKIARQLAETKKEKMN